MVALSPIPGTTDCLANPGKPVTLVDHLGVAVFKYAPNFILGMSCHDFPVSREDIRSVALERALQNHGIRVSELEDHIAIPGLIADVASQRSQHGDLFQSVLA